MKLNIYYSYACRDSYLVYAWLKQVQQRGELLHLNWQPFAIQIDDPNTYWKLPWKFAGSELRGFIAAETAKQQGIDFFDRFHDALEGAVHEQFLELGDETTLLGAAKQAGLNLETFQADWHDRRLAKVAMRHQSQGTE